MRIESVPSLLVTDDDRDLREAMGQILSRHGFETLLAADGQQAVEIVAQKSVHLILLDVDMPRLGGFEAMSLIKQQSEELPCILMSARYDDCLADRARHEKAFAMHPKPITFERMFADIDRALQQCYGWTG